VGYQEKLFSLRQTGVKYSIEPMRELAAYLGHPERGLCFIHIAGTNGKGSVAAMCESIARAAGLKTGLYTSPHLVSFRERFQVDGKPISEEKLERYLARFESRGWPGTFFEISTALALLYFCDEKVDLVAWETGLGGRLDATNIVTPKVSVITSIGFDHTQVLGHTLEAIAAEKAEIIKPGVPVVASCQQPEVLEVIRRKAAASGSALRIITDADLDEFPSPLIGEHQRWNTAAAVAAARGAIHGLSDEVIRQGLSQVSWPGRAQWLETEPPMLLDGAHNPEAAEALAATACEVFNGQKFQLVFGAVRDKDLAGIAESLRRIPGLARVILVAVSHERGAPVEMLQDFFPEAEMAESWPEAWRKVRQAPLPALVTGSLFLVAEVLRQFEKPDERIDAGESWKTHP